MSIDPKEFEKFKDDAVRYRETDEAIGKYRLALFLAILGPGAILVLHLLEIPPERWMKWAIVASAPASVALLVFRFLQIPLAAKLSKPVLMIGLGTLAAAAATFVLGRRFSLLPF
jgi:hypothetical protein